MSNQPNYATVTELPGDEVSQEQLERLYQRYLWAVEYCHGKLVADVACGTGQGLGCIAKVANSLIGGDIDPRLLDMAQRHYGDRITLQLMNAERLPFERCSLDVIILFEAIYYLPSPDTFVAECRRVLTTGGQVLIATANKDLYDFNPSPYSHTYLGVVELRHLFERHGFGCEFLGITPIRQVSRRQRFLRPAKRVAVALGLVPKTMAGKKFLKRLVFGRLVRMPPEIIPEKHCCTACPERISPDRPNTNHKVLLCAATLLSAHDKNDWAAHQPSVPNAM